MPKFPPIPRLSIVIPIGKDLTAFESTLISVLENPVAGSEVLACHDGSYQDPFELGDEIRFVISDSDNPLDLIAAGASQARGRFVHVLSDGIRATSGWADEALEEFEAYDCGIVAPVIRHEATGELVSAGWNDSVARLCQDNKQSQQAVRSSKSGHSGAYLQGSFWRRELLRSLTDAFTSTDLLEASYAFHHLATQAGWQCSLAAHAELLCRDETLSWNKPSISRGMLTQCVKNHFSSGGWSTSLAAALWSVIANVARPGQMLEAIGRGLAPTRSNSLAERVRSEHVASCHQHETIVSMPTRPGMIDGPMRRAA